MAFSRIKTPADSVAAPRVSTRKGARKAHEPTSERDSHPIVSADQGPGPLLGIAPTSAMLSLQPIIQPKLEVGSPDDPLEHEADAMADQVVQRMTQEAAPPATPLHVTENRIQRKCDGCEQDEVVQAKFEIKANPIQTKGLSSQSESSPTLSSRIQLSQGGGKALPPPLLSQMQSGFGQDLSAVRIHTDGHAANLSRDLNAKAFTVGRDIYFGQGQFQPSTRTGQHLLAHELAHTVQQSSTKGLGIQRAPDPQMHDPALNKRFEEGTLTWEDTQNPFVITRLMNMSIEDLRAFLPKLKEPSAITFVKEIIDYKIVPAAAKIKDDQPKVLEADRNMYDALTAYLQALPGRIETLIKSPPKGKEWIQNNPNVDEVVKMISRLGSDFAMEKNKVRFDPTLTGNTMAAYDFQGDRIRLRPSTSAEEIAKTTASLVHEFTHRLQDQAAEDEVMLQKTKKEMLQSDDQKHEVESRKTGAYASALIYMLGDAKDPPDEILSGPMFSENVMASRFETIRNAKTASDKASATKTVTDMVSKAYTESGQFARNTPSVTYYAEVGKYDNHVYLHVGTNKVDLGEVPATVDTKSKLETHLSTKIKADPKAYGVFDRVEPNGRTSKYVLAGILVFFQGTKLADFAIAP